MNDDSPDNSQERDKPHAETPASSETGAAEDVTPPNPFENGIFWKTYLITLAVFIALALVYCFTQVRQFPGTNVMQAFSLGAFFLNLPYILVGLIGWGINREKQRPKALGFLFGGLTPFFFVFITSNGCGLFR